MCDLVSMEAAHKLKTTADEGSNGSVTRQRGGASCTVVMIRCNTTIFGLFGCVGSLVIGCIIKVSWHRSIEVFHQQ
ncbi:hypothetical protein TIFTF001_021237 [Ficus carica]|uniref:Transmembrane protein n=1 Tax=Ficus carica TaxID=3494 RepID=A0AA88AFG3_FICCA|nr:hypothetical protein TIFTF001_021237 [Ficus carica]